MGVVYYLVDDERREVFELGKGRWPHGPVTMPLDVAAARFPFFHPELGETPLEYAEDVGKKAWAAATWAAGRGTLRIACDMDNDDPMNGEPSPDPLQDPANPYEQTGSVYDDVRRRIARIANLKSAL